MLIDEGVRGYSRDQLIRDYRFGMFRSLSVVVIVIANPDMDSDAGQATLDAISPRMIALADWDCGALIPD